VRDALAERLPRAPLRVDVVREPVPGLPGVQDDVRLGDGAAGGLPPLADLVVLEVPLLGAQIYLRAQVLV